MTAQFRITNDAEFSGATVVFPDGSTYTASADHPKYGEITTGLLAGSLTDSQLLDLINPFDAIFRNFYKLSERVSRKGMVLYFDGDVLNNAIAKNIIRILDEDGIAKKDAWESYVKFLENLMQNPSKASIDHVYDFATHHNLTVDEEGFLVLYKSTTDDGLSTHKGKGIVTTADGVTTAYENDFLPNAVGTVVEIPRSLVDENRNAACSVGLHVGAHSYASTFSQKLWTVRVNPRDIVSVPHDASSAKIRVARYEVVGENKTKKEHTAPTVKKADVSTPVKKVAAPTDGSRVDEYKLLIPELLKAGTSLRKFKSKNVTSKRRSEFVEAAKQLGYDIA